MALQFPHGFRNATSFEGNVSDKNLQSLVKATKKSDVLTDVANKAHQDFQAAKVGICQQVTKWAASSGAFFGTAALSVGAVCGATYLALRKPIHEVLTHCTQSMTAENIGTCAQTFVEPLVNNTPFISQSFPVVGPYVSYITPRTLTAAVAALTALDISVGNKTGIRPIRGCVSLAKDLTRAWFAYTSYKAGEVVTRHFELKENEKVKTRESSHKTIVAQELGTFNALSERLMERLQQVDENPKLLVSLKRDVEKLHAKMPWIRQALASHQLTQSEVQQTLDKLSAAIQAIKSMKLELRVPNSPKDTQHNIEFLLTTTEKDIQKKGLGVPTVVREELKRAEESNLGKTHLVKAGVAATAKGTIAALVVGAVIPALAATGAYAAKAYGSPTTWDNTNTCYTAMTNATVLPLSSDSLTALYAQGAAPEAQCTATAGVIGAAATLALMGGLWKGYSVLSRASKERKEAGQAREAHLEKALMDLNTIYSEMMLYLQSRSSNSHEKTLILSKLPVIKKQVEQIAGPNAWSVAELQNALSIRR